MKASSQSRGGGDGVGVFPVTTADERSQRLAREEEFHNHIFADMTPRMPTDKFYSIGYRAKQFYEALITSDCPGKRVLEYGCGTGSCSLLLARSGAIVTGIDISPIAIEQATARAKLEHVCGVVYQTMNAEQMVFGDSSFDLICGSGILHHLDLKRAFAELSRTLKSTGCAVFFEPLGHNPLINLYRKLTPQMRSVDERPVQMSGLRLANKYFERVELYFFNLLTLLAFPLWKVNGVTKLTAVLDAG